MLTKIKKIIYNSSYILRKNKIRMIDFFRIKSNIIDKNKILKINYNENIYKFKQFEIDNNYFILYSYEKNPIDCVSIIISKKDKLAEIHEIGKYKNCLQHSNMNVISTLLKITIKMLKKYKDKLGINIITLADNSIKLCGKEYIILSNMLILLTGDTYYGKYGFRPFDIQVDSSNKRNNENYERNKEIMSKISIKQANILKYIENDNVKKLLDTNPNMLIKDFLIMYLKEYDKTCKYFKKFYNELFEDLGLSNFYRQSFALIV